MQVHTRTLSTWHLGLCLTVASGNLVWHSAAHTRHTGAAYPLLAVPLVFTSALHPDCHDKPKSCSKLLPGLQGVYRPRLPTLGLYPEPCPPPDTAETQREQGPPTQHSLPRGLLSLPTPPWVVLFKVPEPPHSPPWTGASLLFPRAHPRVPTLREGPEGRRGRGAI